MDLAQARRYAADAMPRLLDQLTELVSHPSVAFPGHPREPMDAIVPVLSRMLQDAGVDDARTLDIGGGYPAVIGQRHGPEGAPVVTLYAHYDVQPVPPTQHWDTDPWTATRRDDGRIYGRGAADDKGGLVAILGILGAFKDNEPPCTVRVILEGEEETAGHLEAYVETHPEQFASDLFIVADSGPTAVGKPAVVTALRGAVATTVSVRTLPDAVHSGRFGGAAPDALFVLLRALDAMFDDRGATVIPGLHEFDWESASMSDDDVRRSANVEDGVQLMGSGPVQDRLWSKPSATIIGLDAPPVEHSTTALNPTARAKISLRIAPGADPATELATLKEFLQRHTPLGATLQFEHDVIGPSHLATEGPLLHTAMESLAEAYDTPAEQLGSGGSIPLVNSLLSTKPGAEAVIWGIQDSEKANIHGPNESVDPREIERNVVAGIRLLTRAGTIRPPRSA